MESSFIIIAADLPTLRPIFQVVFDRSAISQGGSDNQRRSRYRLTSMSERLTNGKKAPREQYPTDTIDLVGPQSEERILPPNRIRKTLEVNVNRQDEEHASGSLGGPTYNFGEV